MIKKYFENRTVMFKIALGIGALAIITGLFNIIALSGLGEPYFSIVPALLMFAGAIVFVGLSFTPFVNLGCGLMGCSLFASLIVYAATIYEWPASQVMVSTITGVDKFPEICVCGGLLLIMCILANICAWMRLTRKVKEEK